MECRARECRAMECGAMEWGAREFGAIFKSLDKYIMFYVYNMGCYGWLKWHPHLTNMTLSALHQSPQPGFEKQACWRNPSKPWVPFGHPGALMIEGHPLAITRLFRSHMCTCCGVFNFLQVLCIQDAACQDNNDWIDLHAKLYLGLNRKGLAESCQATNLLQRCSTQSVKTTTCQNIPCSWLDFSYILSIVS